MMVAARQGKQAHGPGAGAVRLCPDIANEQVRAICQKLNYGCVADIARLCKSCAGFVGVAWSLALLRAVLLAVLAMAVAIAPAAPCTMQRHAAADHSSAPADPHAYHRRLATLGGADAPAGSAVHADGGDGADCHRHASAGQQSPGPPGHHKRAAGCVATCCPLACQAAVPDAPWSGDALSLRPSETLGLTQQDGVAEPRPLRIERPPRYRA